MELGISIAISIRCGQFLGAGDPVAAKRVINVGLAVAGTIAVSKFVLMIVLRFEIPKLFTNLK